MTRYSSGVEAERELKRRLERDGHFVVRSAGSKGAFDLVSVDRDGGVFLIQVKRTKKFLDYDDAMIRASEELSRLTQRLPWRIARLCAVYLRTPRYWAVADYNGHWTEPL